MNKGFTEKYNINKLVYFERHITIEDAMLREKRIKKWNRIWKIRLIEKHNPKWNDLSIDFEKKPDNLEIMEVLSGNTKMK